jgi:glycosyltransferase involved in cell wall biosynthesis
MRVLHTVASLRPGTGGPARSVPGLANALASLGIEVHVWSPELTPWHSQSNQFTLHHGALAEALDRIAPCDMIHDHGLWLPTNHSVAASAGRRGIPRIVSPRGMLEPWALNHKKWKKRLAWWLYQRRDLQSAAALHATADSEAHQFECLGLRKPIHIVPNGVDVCMNLESGMGRPGGGKKTALFLSRIQSKKGLPMLVEAWAKVLPQGWQMRVVGPDEDEHRAEVESMVSKAGIVADWTFEGPLEASDKATAFASADLFILPTYSENFGIAVAEALAAGVPVITTRGAPWRGLVETGSGWWVEPTSDALATALADACTRNEGVLREMGGRGREWMLRDFTWKSVASRIIRAYDDVLYRK